MPRPLWKGVVTFGMVTIPVGLYVATESKDVSFNQLHSVCNGRVRQRRWCPVCEVDVPMDQIVKGYEYAKDQYVMLDDEDFEKLPVPSKQTIELAAFVKQDEIDPIYHERTYYIEPEQVGTKAYALLHKALEAKELVALAKVAIRTKERLCALRVQNGRIVMDTLYFPDEIREAASTGTPDVLITDRELAMATSLIDMMTEEFQPERFVDRYREAVLEMIEAKVQGREAVEAPQPVVPEVTDLMAALRASVEAVQKGRPAAEADERRPAKQAKEKVA